MSSHNLTEAQRICDRIGVIKHGKLIREQSVHGDKNLGAPVLRITLTDQAEADKLNHPKTLTVLSQTGVAMLVQPKGDIAASLAELSKLRIAQLTTEQLNLEDEFMEFYGGKEPSA
jgi:ABC-2 type transport system ATP-binding protein